MSIKGSPREKERDCLSDVRENFECERTDLSFSKNI